MLVGFVMVALWTAVSVPRQQATIKSGEAEQKGSECYQCLEEETRTSIASVPYKSSMKVSVGYIVRNDILKSSLPLLSSAQAQVHSMLQDVEQHERTCWIVGKRRVAILYQAKRPAIGATS